MTNCESCDRKKQIIDINKVQLKQIRKELSDSESKCDRLERIFRNLCAYMSRDDNKLVCIENIVREENDGCTKHNFNCSVCWNAYEEKIING